MNRCREMNSNQIMFVFAVIVVLQLSAIDKTGWVAIWTAAKPLVLMMFTLWALPVVLLVLAIIVFTLFFLVASFRLKPR